MKAVVIYTTDGGNTEAYCGEAVAHLKTLGVDVELKHVENASPADLKGVDFYILAEPTWGDGEHYDNWIPFDEELAKADLKGTKGSTIAGCDRSYAQYGVAIDLMEDTLLKAGSQILQKGLKVELEPTEKFYEFLKGSWLPNLVKRAKGELEVEPNTPRMDIFECSAIMGIDPPKEDAAGESSDAANAAMPPKKAVAKVLPPPIDPIAPARQFERKLSSVDKGRRLFTQASSFGAIGFVTGLVHYFFFPEGFSMTGGLFEPPTRFKIGTADDFTVGAVDTRFLASNNIWVVKQPTQLYVILAICTHLGCTPDWKDNENKYKCPCHGSGYYITGENFEGPAPRPMEHCNVSIDPTDGKIVVDKSTVYRKELGQWGTEGSIIPL